MENYDIIIIGGGAAGFFAAINAAEFNPKLKIGILERGKEVLGKVRISGGGRCNVTYAEFLPAELTSNYPRGHRELRGPFHSFMTGDTVEWFEKKGVQLKVEPDGRMFPISDSSETVIDLFLAETQRLGVKIHTRAAVKGIQQVSDQWVVQTTQHSFAAEKILVASGSNTRIWKMLEALGHRVVPGVPSLFSFDIKDQRIADLSGVATEAEVRLEEAKIRTSGPLLITHWGMSGPAILKLSAWAARILSDKEHFKIRVNWVPSYDASDIEVLLERQKKQNPRKFPLKHPQFGLPRRLWQNLLSASGFSDQERWADVSKDHLQELSSQLCSGIFEAHGKSTFKEEFVTAGGVELREINFKSFESKICKNLYLAGEVLNIDAVTGGFNFQNAWTGAYLAARAMTSGSAV